MKNILKILDFWAPIIFTAITGIQALLFFIKGSPANKKAGIVLIGLVKLIFPAVYFLIHTIIMLCISLAGITLIYTLFEIAFMITTFVFEVKATNLI